MYKNPCRKCSDENGYIKAFKHVQGGVCFKCNGKGYTLTKTDPKVLEARRKKAEAVRTAKLDRKIGSSNLMAEELVLKYKDDPRISDGHKERCAQFVLVAMETYKVLERSDNGTYKYVESFPWYVAKAA
jgi:hypothetical protein